MAKKEEGLTKRAVAEVPAIYDPGLAAGDVEGTDNIGGSDLKLAFLAIAQKTSKAIDPTEEGKYIDGLAFGELYNSSTKEIYGRGPVEFIPVRMQKRARLKNADGTLGEAVDWNDPRVIPPWEPGSRVKSVDDLQGVRIYDWAAVLVPSGERIVISFQSTNFGAGKEVNTLVDKHKQLAKLAGKGFRPFQLKLATSIYIEKDGQNSWGKFKIELAGGPTKEQYDFCAAWYETIKDKEFQVLDEDTTQTVE